MEQIKTDDALKDTKAIMGFSDKAHLKIKSLIPKPDGPKIRVYG